MAKQQDAILIAVLVGLGYYLFVQQRRQQVEQAVAAVQRAAIGLW